MTTNADTLARFIAAQDGGTRANPGVTAYDNACIELRAGRKVSHWIWFVFPQGPFGSSEMSRLYAIQDPSEAARYLKNDVLRSRLLDVTSLVNQQLTSGNAIESLMGSSTDTQKLISCLTLFEQIADSESDRVVRDATTSVLDHRSMSAWPRCLQTLSWLATFR
jgi:uncharacterized protein (DUF1810 family)